MNNHTNIIYYEPKDKHIVRAIKPARRSSNGEVLYGFCMENPNNTLIITIEELADDVCYSVPCVVIGKTSKRYSYNTLYVDDLNDNSQKLIEEFLESIPKHVTVFPFSRLSPDFFWQYPVKTEQFAFEKVLETPLDNLFYVGIPFATIIDRNPVCIRYFMSIKKVIDNYKKENPTHKIITSCQHIHYAKIIQTCTFLGITDLYLSHKQRMNTVINSINIHALPLYPVNILDTSRQIGLESNASREYLFSFIGAYMRHYLNPIRRHILSWPPSDKYVIKDTNIWHFEKNVYQHQVCDRPLTNKDVKQQEEQTFMYNYVLSKSVFSLCPVGAGPNTIRLWESICVGAIPVIIANEFNMKDFVPKEFKEPFYIELTYDSKYLKTAETLVEFLETFSHESIDKMRSECYKVGEYVKNRFVAI